MEGVSNTKTKTENPASAEIKTQRWLVQQQEPKIKKTKNKMKTKLSADNAKELSNRNKMS